MTATAVAPSRSAVDVVADVDLHRERLRRRRAALLALAAALVALVVLDQVLGAISHGQRQRHLAVAFTQPTTHVRVGDALLVLQIPSLGFSETVSEGSSAAQLRAGPGHVVGTALPGQAGNTVIAAHRSRFGGSFGQLSTLEVGAQIALKTRSNLVRDYQVTSVRTVDASKNRALDRSRTEELTLVTSASGLLPGRLVVVRAQPYQAASPASAASAPAAAGSAPTAVTPKATAVTRYDPAPGSLDSSSTGALVWLGAVACLVVIGLGWRWLSRRYRPSTVIWVLAPVAGLLVVCLLTLADAIGPATW